MVYQRKKRTHEPEPRQQVPQVQTSLFTSPDLETEEADTVYAPNGPTAAPNWDAVQRQIDNPLFDFGSISILPPDSAVQRQPVDPSTLSKQERFRQRVFSVQRDAETLSGPLPQPLMPVAPVQRDAEASRVQTGAMNPLSQGMSARHQRDQAESRMSMTQSLLQLRPLSMQLPIQRDVLAGENAMPQTAGNAGEQSVNLTPKGSGRPLPKQVSDNFVHSGYPEVKNARVHVDDAATQSIQAKAYTQKNDIVVQSSGANDPQLLAHEATHVVQQSKMALKPDVNGTPINANRVLEQNADDNGERVARNEPVEVEGVNMQQPTFGEGLANVVQRQEEETYWGKFNTKEYKIDDTDTAMKASMHLEFKPGSQINAKKIGFVQAVRATTGDGKSVYVSPMQSSRTVSHGSSKGFSIDRTRTKNSPIYGTKGLSSDEGLADVKSMLVSAQNLTEFGHRYRAQNAENWESKNAEMKDKAGAAKIPGMKYEFETTALALEGEQKDQYYGSVSWGFENNENGKAQLYDFKLKSEDSVHDDLKKSVQAWNEAEVGVKDKIKYGIKSNASVYVLKGKADARKMEKIENTGLENKAFNFAGMRPSQGIPYYGITLEDDIKKAKKQNKIYYVKSIEDLEKGSATEETKPLPMPPPRRGLTRSLWKKLLFEKVKEEAAQGNQQLLKRTEWALRRTFGKDVAAEFKNICVKDAVTGEQSSLDEQSLFDEMNVKSVSEMEKGYVFGRLIKKYAPDQLSMLASKSPRGLTHFLWKKLLFEKVKEQAAQGSQQLVKRTEWALRLTFGKDVAVEFKNICIKDASVDEQSLLNEMNVKSVSEMQKGYVLGQLIKKYAPLSITK